VRCHSANAASSSAGTSDGSLNSTFANDVGPSCQSPSGVMTAAGQTRPGKSSRRATFALMPLTVDTKTETRRRRHGDGDTEETESPDQHGATEQQKRTCLFLVLFLVLLIVLLFLSPFLRVSVLIPCLRPLRFRRIGKDGQASLPGWQIRARQAAA
jgi:hypothetical protein